jgi:hypothetical protein
VSIVSVETEPKSSARGAPRVLALARPTSWVRYGAAKPLSKREARPKRGRLTVARELLAPAALEHTGDRLRMPGLPTFRLDSLSIELGRYGTQR